MTGISLRGVSRTIAGVPIVTDVSFEVPAGERLALVGESGSGKSTILRLLGGFDRVDAGEIDLGARRLSDRRTHVPPRRRRIAYAPQEGALFPHLTAAANIGFGVPRRDRSSRVREVARLVGLDAGLLGRFPHELSGGQQQRVALGRALATRPEAVLLDEPFSALDTGLRESTREEVVAVLAASRTTTVLVTHDQREALRFGQRIGVVDGGALVQVGTPAELLDAPETLAVFRILGPATVLAASGDGEHVRTALGGVAIGNDRAAGAATTVIALRPGQVVVEPDGSGDAVVTARHDDGDRVRLVLLAGTERVDADLDRPAAAGVAIGDRVRAAVRGPASRYQAPLDR